jgi:hypothetical protein
MKTSVPYIALEKRATGLAKDLCLRKRYKSAKNGKRIPSGLVMTEIQKKTAAPAGDSFKTKRKPVHPHRAKKDCSRPDTLQTASVVLAESNTGGISDQNLPSFEG